MQGSKEKEKGLQFHNFLQDHPPYNLTTSN